LQTCLGGGLGRTVVRDYSKESCEYSVKLAPARQNWPTRYESISVIAI